MSLKGIDELTIRYAAGIDGGIVDVRQDAPDGPVVGTATLTPTASWTDFQNVTIPLTTDDRSGRLYFTFRGRPGMNPTDLFDLDEFTFVGKGDRVELDADRVGARPTRSPARRRWP